MFRKPPAILKIEDGSRRKIYMFAGSHDGPKRAVIIYSFLTQGCAPRNLRDINLNYTFVWGNIE